MQQTGRNVYGIKVRIPDLILIILYATGLGISKLNFGFLRDLRLNAERNTERSSPVGRISNGIL